MKMRHILAALAALAIGPAGQAAAPTLPPYMQAYEPAGVDERGLWMQMDEFERDLRASPFVIADADLNAYVRGVLCRTVGEDRCRSVRLYVLRNDGFNATMAPNGMMMLWSGLLLRTRDEAELGAVLGHEFAHFELRHSLAAFRQRRGVGDFMTWAAVLAPNVYSSVSLAAIGSVFSFSRAQEQEADLLGLRYLVDSPYPAAAAAPLWERLMAEQDASAAGRKRKPAARRYSAGLFASHPTELSRATYLRAAAAKAADAGDPAPAAYRVGLAKWRLHFLADQIKLNDFGGTDYLLGQLAADGWTPDLLFARGELYRQRGNVRDLVSAAQFYQSAIDGGFAGTEAHRGLGLSLLRSQQVDAGRAALRTYLDRAPDAPDAAMMKMLVAQ